MIIGLNLPNYGALGTRDSVTTIARRAEDLGYASLWTSDHVLLPTDQPEPFGHLLETFTTLAYVAAQTDHIRLATGILVLPQRDPVLVAKQAATVHHLSGDRLTLGVAAGWIEREYDLLRADFRHRGAIEEEYIAALRTLFDDERPEFHGVHVGITDALFSPRPVTPLRIVVGGNSPVARRRAAVLADGWHGIGLTPDQVHPAVTALRETAVRAPFTISLRTPVRVGGVPDRLVAPPLHGAPDVITHQFASYAAAGVDHLVLEPVAESLPDFLNQMTRLAALHSVIDVVADAHGTAD